jgi:lipopolysaccharide transport protein LptA
MMRIVFVFLFLLLAGTALKAQVTRDTVDAGTTTRTPDTGRIVNIIKADKFKMIDKDTVKLNMFVGNVLIKQGNTFITCDSVVQNQQLNQVEAFGNVHINDADSVHTYSQYLKYLGDSRVAYLRKNVRLTDGKGTLTTNELEYDLNSGIGVYKNNGKLIDGDNVLTSKEGFYYSDTKEAYFIDNVRLVSPDRTVATDTLLYNVDQDIFTIVSPTTINDGSTVIRTRSGIYDVKNGLANFTERTLIEDSSQQVIADQINFDKNTGKGTAEGNVIYRDTAQGVTILAGSTAFNNTTKDVLATRKPVMVIKQEKDSIYVAADTLYSSMTAAMGKQQDSLLTDSLKSAVPDSVVHADSIRIFQAYRNVRIFSDSLQGVCDSLYYSAADSVFRMYREPYVWSGENQINGDTIYMFTRNKKPDQLYVFENGFAISRTKENFFNQIRGNRINGQFVNGEIDYMRAKGNAESVYYLQDEDSAYVGMNYAKADAITMYFGKDGLKRVSWVNTVEGTTFPMNQIPEEKRILRNFKWMDQRRPKTRLELFE